MKFGHYSREELGITRNLTCAMFDSKGAGIIPPKPEADDVKCGENELDEAEMENEDDELSAELDENEMDNDIDEDMDNELNEEMDNDLDESMSEDEVEMENDLYSEMSEGDDELALDNDIDEAEMSEDEDELAMSEDEADALCGLEDEAEMSEDDEEIQAGLEDEAECGLDDETECENDDEVEMSEDDDEAEMDNSIDEDMSEDELDAACGLEDEDMSEDDTELQCSVPPAFKAGAKKLIAELDEIRRQTNENTTAEQANVLMKKVFAIDDKYVALENSTLKGKFGEEWGDGLEVDPEYKKIAQDFWRRSVRLVELEWIANGRKGKNPALKMKKDWNLSNDIDQPEDVKCSRRRGRGRNMSNEIDNESDNELQCALTPEWKKFADANKKFANKFAAIERQVNDKTTPKQAAAIAQKLHKLFEEHDNIPDIVPDSLEEIQADKEKYALWKQYRQTFADSIRLSGKVDWIADGRPERKPKKRLPAKTGRKGSRKMSNEIDNAKDVACSNEMSREAWSISVDLDRPAGWKKVTAADFNRYKKRLDAANKAMEKRINESTEDKAQLKKYQDGREAEYKRLLKWLEDRRKAVLGK